LVSHRQPTTGVLVLARYQRMAHDSPSSSRRTQLRRLTLLSFVAVGKPFPQNVARSETRSKLTTGTCPCARLAIRKQSLRTLLGTPCVVCALSPVLILTSDYCNVHLHGSHPMMHSDSATIAVAPAAPHGAQAPAPCACRAGLQGTVVLDSLPALTHAPAYM